MEWDEKYEFNAPKYFDFEKPDDSGNCDIWFDQREGDEGGISFNDSSEHTASFTTATNALSTVFKGDNPSTNSCKTNIPAKECLPGETDDPSNTNDTAESKIGPHELNISENEMSIAQPNNITIEQIRSNVENDVRSPKDKPVLIREPLRDKAAKNNHNTQECISNEIPYSSVSNVNKDNESTAVNSSEPNEPTNKCGKSSHGRDVEEHVSNETMLCYAASRLESQTDSRSGSQSESQSDDFDSQSESQSEDTADECEDPSNQGRRRTWSTPQPPRSLQELRNETAGTTGDTHATKPGGVKFATPPLPRNLSRMPTRASAKKARDTPKPPRASPKTPKSRFQPVRKSTAKAIDYADKKRKYTPRKFVMDEPEHKKARRTEEQRNLEKARKLQEKTKRHRLQNERNMAKALKGKSFQPMRSVSVTQPKEFDFVMANKSKGHSSSLSARSASTTPFEKKLRQESLVNSYKNEPTHPVPFNFILPEKIKSSQVTDFVSMAEANSKFLMKKTPSRACKKSSIPHITRPVTPKLMTRKRTRAPLVESAQEIEDKIVNEMKSYQFKATELNPKILEMKGLYGVKEAPVAPNTEQEPFNFRIEQRIKERKPQEEENKNEINKTKKPKNFDRPTVPQPFTFENRDKDRLLKKEQKMKQIEEEERKAREFHARGLPSFSPQALPEVETKEPTEIAPFKVSERSELYRQQYELKLKAEEEEERRRREFKASKCDVTVREPFQPIKGLIPSTNFDNVQLHTEQRAQLRTQFDDYLLQKEKEKEEARLRLEKEREEEEEEEIRRMRKEMVPKSYPIRTFKPVEVKKSTIPLTEPMTPNLRVKQRATGREKEQ